MIQEWCSIDLPHTHSVPDLSLLGFLLPRPELHYEAHCRSDTFPDQSAACHPWTILTIHRYMQSEGRGLHMKWQIIPFQQPSQIYQNILNMPNLCWVKCEYLILGLGALCMTQVNWVSSPATKIAFLILLTKRGGTTRHMYEFNRLSTGLITTVP